MIIIDNATASNTLILTLKEKSVGNNPVYKFEFFNFYTHETYYYTNITTTTSNERKDVINLTSSQEFLGRTCSVGQYRYTVYQTGLTGASSSAIVEVGMLKVINSAPELGDIYIQPTETDDDYITL